MKYLNYRVVFREIPNEVTLAVNLTNCPCHCTGCHSPELWEDKGEELSTEAMLNLLKKEPGCTCLCLMGGDSKPSEVIKVLLAVKALTGIKVGWYSGRNWLPEEWRMLDYIKLGPYIESLGPLNSPTTNQRLFEVKIVEDNAIMIDVTHKLQR